MIGANAICCASHATTSSKSRVCVRARPRPRHRLQAHAAVAAAQPSQLALDDAAAGAEIQVPPALDAPVVDLQLPAGLAALGAHAPAAPQPDRHHHALAGEADIDHGRSGQAEQPLECRDDAHVALLARPLTFEQPAACATGGGASLAFCATSENFSARETPAQRDHRGRFTPKSSGDPKELSACTSGFPSPTRVPQPRERDRSETR